MVENGARICWLLVENRFDIGLKGRRYDGSNKQLVCSSLRGSCCSSARVVLCLVAFD